MNIEKIKAAALRQPKGVSLFDRDNVLELITQLEETEADLAHANSITIKIEKLIEGVEYRGDYAEGVRVLKDSLEVAKKDAAKVRKETINEVYDTAFANFARPNVLEAIRKMAEEKP